MGEEVKRTPPPRPPPPINVSASISLQQLKLKDEADELELQQQLKVESNSLQTSSAGLNPTVRRLKAAHNHPTLQKANSDQTSQKIWRSLDEERVADGEVAGKESDSADERAAAGMDRLKEVKEKVKEKFRRHTAVGRTRPNNLPNPEYLDQLQKKKLEAPIVDIPSTSNEQTTVRFRQKRAVKPTEEPPRRALDDSETLDRTQSSEALPTSWLELVPLSDYRFLLGLGLIGLSLLGVLPSFLLGLLWGMYLSLLVASVVFSLFLPVSHPISESDTTSQTSRQALLTPDDLEEGSKLIYKGWMNELPGKYSPSAYHINNSRSVLIRLDGSVLRLSAPKNNVWRHAACDDPTMRDPPPTFVSQRLFDMTGAEVVLRPRYLAKRRWWSRKYPICLKLRSGSELSGGSGLVTRQRSASEDELVATAMEHRVDLDLDKESDPDENDDEDITEDEDETGLFKSRSADALAQQGMETEKKKRKKKILIYLFARSGREKENWFHRFRQVSCQQIYRQVRDSAPKKESSCFSLREAGRPPQRVDSVSSTRSAPPSTSPCSIPEYDDVFGSLSPSAETRRSSELLGEGEGRLVTDTLAAQWIMYATQQKEFTEFMSGFLSPPTTPEAPDRGTKQMDLALMKWRLMADSPLPTTSRDSIAWANALAARIFYDFSRDPQWINTVRNRIQRKLATIHLPYFIETLSLSKLEPGMQPPRIVGVYQPTMNPWGLWIDLQLEYSGGLKLVLETKLNLMKLKSGAMAVGPEEEGGSRWFCAGGRSLSPSRYSDEDVPESPESSPDEDSKTTFPIHKQAETPGGTPRESRRDRIMKILDKVVQSDTFQAATDNKYVKKVMQGISETPLILMVEVMYLEGTLALNIPPPPSDRLWYSFREPPRLSLRALPRVGEKVVGLNQVTEWIQNRLRLLLNKNLVLPNMDDIQVPVMSGPRLHGYNH